MADNKFDEFVRNRIINYSSGVPEDMWQRIQQKKKNDRILLFILWLLAICLTLFIGGYFIFNSNKNTHNNTPVSGNTLPVKSPITPGKPIINPVTNSGDTATTGSLQPNNKQVSLSNEFKNKQDEKVISKQTMPAKKNQIILTVGKDENIRQGGATDSSINDVAVEIDIAKEPTDSSLSVLTGSPLPKDSATTKKLRASPNENKKESESSTNKNTNWFLEAYVSPDIPYFERTNDNTNINDHGKSAPTSYTIDIRVGKNLGNRLSVKTGLQYSQVSEKFFDSLIIIDRYRSIDIPFLIGYDLTTSPFKTIINAGVIYNIYSWYRGLTLIDYRGLIDINVANIYRHNTGVSLYLGINLSKKIDGKIELIAEPYFKYPVSFMTRSSAPFNQKINIAGLNIGVRYNFYKGKKH